MTVAPRAFQIGSAADLSRPEVIANPYPFYADLRDRSPLFGYLDYPPGTIPGVDTPRPSWAVLRYADVQHVCRNHQLFSSRDEMQEQSAGTTLMLVNHDPPYHTILRAMAFKAFTPARIASLAAWMRDTVNAMLDEEPDIEREVDFMRNLAPDLPARVMCHLMGVPASDYKRIRMWANAFMVTAENEDGTPLSASTRQQYNREVDAYFTAAVDERYAELARGIAPPDDLITAFIQAEENGQQLTREEVIRFCVTVVVAGAETTTYYLGNLLGHLLDSPALFDTLKRDRSQVRAFLEESARHSGPVQRLHRVCTQDTQLGDTEIKAGDWVAIFFAAANRDPAVFDHPDEFWLERPNANRHLTFSHGIHYCLGTNLARLESETMLSAIFERYKGVAAGSSAAQRQTGGSLNYGWRSLPLVFQR